MSESSDRIRRPGIESQALTDRLARVESPGVTTLTPEPPIFWKTAQGSHVVDVDEQRYVDLTAAFGVSSVGHAHPRVVRAISAQSEVLLHGMGDVYPPAIKVELLEALASIAPEPLNRSVLSLNGADSVETALKCAELVTGKAGVFAFHGAYHGLSYGALTVTSRQDFKEPFAGKLKESTTFFSYPNEDGDVDAVIREMERALRDSSNGTVPVGAVIVEPVQGRGGVRIPPASFLPALRRLCDRFDLFLIVDEIFTGLGRTGELFAVNHWGVVPDLMCIGKALGGGMPLSACMGTERSLGQWPVATGEALHTSTFLAHPTCCAAALASLAVIREESLPQRAHVLGRTVLEQLADAPVVDVRGLGLMIGVELESGERCQSVVKSAREHGVLLLPSGEQGEVISLTPPLTIDEHDLHDAIEILKQCLRMN